MKKVLLLLLQIAMASVIYAQAYTINHFQSNYDTLTGYNSVNVELGLAGADPYLWEKNFEFGFSFPFFGQTYDTVTLDSDAVGYFSGSSEYNLYLFAAEYTTDEILDTAAAHSEVRYKHTALDGAQALAVEFRNAYLYDEYMENGTNHYVNFQMWFFENGIIEVRFGDIDLANCSYYFPGYGFSFDNTNPDDEIYGPWMSINNSDVTESACLFGDFSDPEKLYDEDESCGVLTSIPPTGSVVQFIPSGMTSTEQAGHQQQGNTYRLLYRDGVLEVIGNLEQYESCTIYDVSGRIVAQSNSNRIAIGPSRQVYVVQIISTEGVEAHKLVLNN